MRVMKYCCDDMVSAVKSGTICLPRDSIFDKAHYVYAYMNETKEYSELKIRHCPFCGAPLPICPEIIKAVDLDDKNR
jgi:hypothetical protein